MGREAIQHNGGQFIPPSVDKLTLDMPGFGGGGGWSGTALDPATGGAVRVGVAELTARVEARPILAWRQKDGPPLS
jgi:hypothetical protein